MLVTAPKVTAPYPATAMWLSIFNPENAPELGEAALDEEHRLIEKYLDRLHAAILMRQSTSDQRLLLHEALSFLRINCSHEEELMMRDLFPHVEEHKGAHQRLFHRGESLDYVLATATCSRSLEVLDDVSNELLQHINQDDRDVVMWHRRCCRGKA
jgi:hemerythrin-like metal-binding protein